MPRVSKKDVLEQRQNAAAPFLFDEENLPLNPAWVQAVREKRYEHTGERLLDDDVKVQRMVDLLCLGTGVKRVARAMGVSAHCVRAAREVLVAQGKLAPFVQRFVAKSDEVIEDGLDAVHEAILNGRMHPNFISSAIGIVFDKRALARGEPTTISVAGSLKLAPENVSAKKLNDWADGRPSEGESSGSRPFSGQTAGGAVPDATPDAGEQPPKAATAC